MIPILPSEKRGIKEQRPLLKPEMTPSDWLLEAVSLGLTGFLVGFAIYWYSRLPETIPTHFNVAGEVDGVGPRSMIWLLPGIALFIYVLLSILVMVPHTFNFPVKITPQNAMRQYTLAIRMIRILKPTLILLFTMITMNAVRASAGRNGFGPWFMPLFLGMVFIPLIIYFIMAMRKN